MPVNNQVISEDREPRPQQSEDALPINELFYSIQGEGSLAGIPSVFIRTSGCNLRCWYCDSYHTSWDPTHAWMEIDEIVDEVEKYEQAEHVVVTGGEPLIHDETATLIERFDELGYHITVETNGTIFCDAPIDLMSISPKLASSTPTSAKDPTGEGNWTERHDERRIDIGVLSKLVDTYECQLKFVVTNENDLSEINSVVSRIGAATNTVINDTDVLLMPEGMTRERLEETRSITAELAMEQGYRYTPRLHVNLWEDAPGR